MTGARRLVLMRIADDQAAERVRRAHASFAAIPGVRCAVAVQRPGVRDGRPDLTHVSIFEFTDPDTRARYHEHPLHQGARDAVRADVQDVVVLDLD